MILQCVSSGQDVKNEGDNAHDARSHTSLRRRRTRQATLARAPSSTTIVGLRAMLTHTFGNLSPAVRRLTSRKRPSFLVLVAVSVGALVVEIGWLDYALHSDSDEEGGLDANESQAPRRGPGGLDLNDPLVAKLFGEDGRGGDPEALASLSRAELVRGIALSVQTGDILGEANFGRMLGRHLLAVEQAADEAHEEVLMADAEAALREAKARFEALGAPQQQLEDEFHTCCVDLATALRRGGKAAEALPLLSAAAEFGERTADTARRSAAAAARPAAQREAISNEGNARLLHAQAELGLGDSHR